MNSIKLISDEMKKKIAAMTETNLWYLYDLPAPGS